MLGILIGGRMNLIYLAPIVFLVIYIMRRKNEQQIANPQNGEDDIESLDDVTYLIKDDISYVMYKFDSAYLSKYLSSWKFTKISDTEGEIVFGAPAIASAHGRGNSNYGFMYKVKIEPQGENTLLYMTYIGKTTLGTIKPSKFCNQLYHFFIKEQFDVLEVIKGSRSVDPDHANLVANEDKDNRKKHIIATGIYSLIFLILFAHCYSDNKDTEQNYHIVKAGEGRAYVPIEYWNASAKESYEDYCYLETDECQMIIIDYPASIEQDIKDKMGLTDDVLSCLNQIKNEDELQAVFNLEDEDVIKKVKTDRPSFQIYELMYEKEDKVVSVFIYHIDDRSMYQIIIADKEYFTDKEYSKMYGNLYRKQCWSTNGR
jgi:hypothetical protein